EKGSVPFSSFSLPEKGSVPFSLPLFLDKLGMRKLRLRENLCGRMKKPHAELVEARTKLLRVSRPVSCAPAAAAAIVGEPLSFAHLTRLND
ncbi:MAG: hypothetical protein WEB85_01810, partial [Dongiaceae bacterium]